MFLRTIMKKCVLNPNEFLVDLTRIPYEQILKPDKQYEHCAIIRDSIQDNISQHSASLQKNLNKKTDNIFMFDDIHPEECDHVIKTMESYFTKKEYHIEKWEQNKNVNCMYVSQIKELDDMVFNIINKVVQKLHIHYDIQCNGDSGVFVIEKIYGSRTRIHTDGIFC